ncbi:Beta-galactosidase [Arachis hypogaea]|nr:Beta-galactosidase [Arachis hypogaea]
MIDENLQQSNKGAVTFKWDVLKENAGIWGEADFVKTGFVDLINTTKDTTDYLWHTTSIYVGENEEFLKNGSKPVLLINSTGHALHAFVNQEYQGTGTGNGTHSPFFFKNPIPLRPGKNEIALLCLTVGLPTAGPFYDFLRAGLISVKIKGFNNGTVDLSSSAWSYKIGVQGEQLKLYQGDGWSSVKWTTTSEPPKGQALTWYKAVVDAPSGDEPIGLDMLHMGKGLAWLNGEEIGRYWSRNSKNGNTICISKVHISTLYILALSQFAFPSHESSSSPSFQQEIFKGSRLFRMYVIVGTAVDLFLLLAYVLGGFARGDEHAVRSATPHLFLLSCQILTENVISGLSLFSPPVRALVPMIYTVRRIFVDVDWIHDVWLNKTLSATASLRDIIWFLPRAFEKYLQQKGEIHAKSAEEKRSSPINKPQSSEKKIE